MIQLSNTCESNAQTANQPAEVVYENVFEAIRALEPQNPACNGAAGDGSLIRRQEYAPTFMGDYTIGIIEQREQSMLLRGETSLYPECKASLYRVSDKRKRIAERVKAQDFMLLLSSLEEVRRWQHGGLHLNLPALAQHYGFATEMLDLTSDIVVAAFFATHYFDTRKLRFEVVSAGVGRIRYVQLPKLAERAFPIGLQPFQRPGLQSGFGVLLGEGEDFAQMSESVRFKQGEEMNRRFSRAILTNRMTLPNEDIMQVATLIHDSPVVTQSAVQALCSAQEMQTGFVFDAIAELGISIVDAPLVTADCARLRSVPRKRVTRVAVSQPSRI